ncbi:MAG: NADH-quinone oxidoreductase subunit NuoF [Desulfovermiculus sp.]|nr:NADH-quinone oxidoreductase subunit NuoF [Desulfovermiculus sp.]
MPEHMQIKVFNGQGCQAKGSNEIYQTLVDEVHKQGLQDQVDIIDVQEEHCPGYCALAPSLMLEPSGEIYKDLQVKDIPELVHKLVVLREPPSKKRVRSKSLDQIPDEKETPFFGPQLFWVLRNRGRIDPESIEEYIARNGYQGAAKALLDMHPDEIIEEVKKSVIRGRGGAGFPAHIKWKAGALAEADIKYVVCNADEGDPGAFMDRSILEGDPHAVLEGMVIAARAIGSHFGYIYCRTEYPLAIRRLSMAIDQAMEYGLLGKDILGSGFDFHVQIYQGAGAFVCGEGTALQHSIEGKRGMPRPKPPRSTDKGLFDKPTVLNNVETLANIPQIIVNGGDWYASVGTEKSKGTKVFALSGDVKNIGLVEVPMGTTLRQIIFEIGQGIPNKKNFKAVQLGGPSGGCIPEKYLDLPVDFEAISQANAIMGSGGMIVMDESTCMVDMAHYFMDFIQDESCGKCPPCREGTKRLLDVLTRIKQGGGQIEDLDQLETLAAYIQDTSLCGLGQSASTPVVSALRSFREEFEAHVLEKRCPAKKCPQLMKFVVDPEKCTSCGQCYRACPVEAISWKKKEPAFIDRDKCIQCMTCIQKCQFDAID